jgi:hypothetical protein
MSRQDVFIEIYRTNKWRAASRSGGGSGVAVTTPVREALQLLAPALGVRVLLDAPCGDHNWMRLVDLDLEAYIGVDIVPSVIEENQIKYEDSRRSFLVADIVADVLPASDLVLCRDCLVHLTDEDALATIHNIKASGARYLLATTFFAMDQNPAGSTGGWRPVNLQRPPFSFPRPLLLVPERTYNPAERYSDKSLGLWPLAALL